MLTARELYYLNDILNNKNLLGIYRAESIIENMESEITAEEELVKKNIINEDRSINETSFQLINKLEQYKNSGSYININDVIFSVDMIQRDTVYIKKCSDKLYEVERINKSLLIHSLIEKYPFLKGEEEVEKETYDMELIQVINEKIKDMDESQYLFIKKGDEEKAQYSYIFFNEENSLYKYDVIRRKLEKVSSKHIRMELFRLFEVRRVK